MLFKKIDGNSSCVRRSTEKDREKTCLLWLSDCLELKSPKWHDVVRGDVMWRAVVESVSWMKKGGGGG
jgi:hypothetical protein